jgi:large subunit ribosomal protein L21
MYAVIETGGKQYRVELGTELEVELLDVEPGQEITLDRVLLVADGDKATVGRPLVKDAAVKARVLRQDRGEKVVSFKYRPKARRRVKKGHRQELTVLKITDVRLGAKSAAADAEQAEVKAGAERDRIAKAAARQAAEDAALAEKLKARRAAPAAGEAEAPPEAKPAPKPAAKASPAKPAAEAPAKPAAPKPAAEAVAKPAAKKAEPAADAAPKKPAATQKDK